MNELGLIHCYTGDGKGKTTSSIGLIIRALGHHYKIGFIQFLKGISYYGELFFLYNLYPDVIFYHFGKDCPKSSLIRQGFEKCDSSCRACFVNFNNPSNEDLEYVKLAFEKTKEASKIVDILVLDEINLALKYNLLPMKEFLDFINEKPKNLEIILTGRDAPKEVIEISDYVSEIKMIKHPFYKGISGRRGIEY
ncbi:MAG TPA: cob(I)yrinic acid a,c-diamide adenosyltransferase [Caldisericia bacterium]|nr:cob(I)yrinic acid a,c-diamide adenosyltransferase [Caldisericia bacterium]